MPCCYKEYFKYSTIWMDEIEHDGGRVTGLTNTNKLVRFYDGCDSGKTGFTSEAGHCLAASAKRGDMRLVAVVISEPDSKTRFGEVSAMFNYGFANYQNKLIVDKNTPLDLKIDVENGKKDKLEVIPENAFYLFSGRNKMIEVQVDFKPFEKVKAPIKKGEIVGELVIYKDNIEIGKVNVLANEEILSKTYFDIIKDIINNWAI